MKKIASFFATLAAVAALSSCSQDDSPVLQKPTEFKLNTPPFAEQLYQLTEDGELSFTCSQPDYGLGVATTYGAEISLTEDFAESRKVTLTNPLSATLTFSASETNLAILDMLGIVDEDTWAPYADNRVMPLYVRATAQAAEVEYSKISSNVVKLPNVEIYFAIPVPGYIYLIGNYLGDWIAPLPENADALKDWRLFEAETAIGSKVYSAVFTLPVAPMFRFYTALTPDDGGKGGWNANSFGSQAEDNPVDVALVDGELSTALVEGKGSFNFPDFPGGEMTITVDMVNMTVKFQAGAVEVVPPVQTTYVYMVGNNANWAPPCVANQAIYDNWRLTCSDGSGVYSGTFDLAELPADDLYCRFFDALGNDEWNGVKSKWAADADGSVNVEVTSGTEYPTVVGDGCFQMLGAKGKKVDVVLDTKANKVKFTFVD